MPSPQRLLNLVVSKNAKSTAFVQLGGNAEYKANAELVFKTLSPQQMQNLAETSFVSENAKSTAFAQLGGNAEYKASA